MHIFLPPMEEKRLSMRSGDDCSTARPSNSELAVRMLPLRQLVALDIVARCDGRLNQAAKLQGISCGALSRQITRLEAVLDADVVKTSTKDRRTFELTEEGEMLVEALRIALPALEKLLSSFHHAMTPPLSKKGSVRRPVGP